MRANLLPVVLDARVVTSSGGGPDKTILNSPRFLKKLGYRNVCAYMHPPGDAGFATLQEKAARWGAPLLSIPDRGPWDWQVITESLRICRRERVQIWHGHDYKSNALGLLLRRFWPMKLVTTVHGWVKNTRRTPLYYGIDRVCLPYYESVICVSEDLLDESRKSGVAADRCILIENGIDTEQFRRRCSTSVAKQKLGIQPDRFVVGGVGRLSLEKGFDILLKAVGQLIVRGVDAQLLLAGEGEERNALAVLAERLGIQERVRFLGYCADVRDVYEALDVFALSSHREGLPNVVLEAMAGEVPVVATRIAGVPRLVQDNETGLLVEPNDPNALAAALSRIADDHNLGLRLCGAARQRVEMNYSFAQRMRKVASIYDQLLLNALRFRVSEKQLFRTRDCRPTTSRVP